MKILLAALLISSSANAEEMICDMQHQCYHGDLEHPDRVTPPPAPQYQRGPAVSGQGIELEPSTGQQCQLVTMQAGPEIPAQIVEICSIPDDQARVYRNMQRQNQAQEAARNAYVPDIYVPWRRK